jgi:acyl-CoA thioester hydrolase
MQNFKIPSITKIIFHTILEVRISDINYGNHLGHDSFISLLHEARVRFLKELGYTDELNINGLGMLITNLVVNYVNEAFYPDKITINIEIGDVTRTSLQLIYQAVILENNQEIAKALTTMTFYDYQKSKVAKIPQQFLTSIGLNVNSPL